MLINFEESEKVKEFLQEVMLFATGKSTKFVVIDELVNQAVIILTIEQLQVQINTLESIKHLLNDKQTNDINTMIKKYEGIKSNLYDSIRQA